MAESTWVPKGLQDAFRSISGDTDVPSVTAERACEHSPARAGFQRGGASTQMISGGIAEALVATGAGIFIAILAVVFLNHFNKKVGNILHQMELLKVMTLNRLVP